MSTVNYPNPGADNTVKVFDNFYNFAVDVPVNEYDLVFSFFNKIFDDSSAAKNFTASFFQITYESNIPVQELLAQIQNKDQLELSSVFAYYLNNLRSKATLLGVSSIVTPRYYAARNVLP
jgi:hypothetical protein